MKPPKIHSILALLLALAMLLSCAVSAIGLGRNRSQYAIQEDPAWQTLEDPEDDPAYWERVNNNHNTFVIPDYPDDTKDFTNGPTVKYVNGRWTYINRRGLRDETYSGLAENAAGWWYVKNGYVDFDVTNVVYHPGTDSWWFVRNNKVTPGPDVQYNAAGWWYINNKGKVDFSHNEISHNAAGWWYIRNGKVDFNFTGIGKNAAGYWYCRNGKVDFNYTGIVRGSTRTWQVKNGKVVS